MPRTALERKIAGIPIVKPKRVVTRRAVSSRSVSSTPTYSSSYSSPLVDETPTYETPSYESPNLFLGSSYGAESYSTSVPDVPELREMRLCGKCEGYLEKIQVAIVMVSAPLRVGDRVLFESESGGLFEQTLGEMQINREDVMTAYSGDDIGMKVKAVPKKNGNVYKVI